VYVILGGEGLLDEGEGKRKVSAGDAILTGRGSSHSIENSGNQDLELIAFIATYPEIQQ
jgi:mannose-6-phosphate isomerase-like protein (cupin superfamily)